MYHAKFYFDVRYQQEMKKLWKSLNKNKRKEIKTILSNLGYKKEFYLDEFQAYLYSDGLFTLD
jgi:mRNA-degrading endonuclease RelE of RelBE toxin-antitoxin system